MPQNLLSPDVVITETDATTGTVAVSTSIGAFAGVFRWGPVNQIVSIDSEPTMVKKFGTPTNYNAETFFSAANFLAYSNNLKTVRAANTSSSLYANVFPVSGNFSDITDSNMIVTDSSNTMTSNNVDFSNTAVFNSKIGDFILIQQVSESNTANVVTTNFRQITGANSSALELDEAITFTNSNNSTDQVVVTKLTGSLSAFANTDTVDEPASQVVLNDSSYVANNYDSNILYIAKYPGALGNSLRVSVCDSSNAYNSNLLTTNCAFTVGNTSANLQFANVDVANSSWQSLTKGDFLAVGNSSIGTQYIQVSDKGVQPASNSFSVTLASKYALAVNYTKATSIPRYWEFYRNVNGKPGQSTFVAASGNSAANDELHIVITDHDGKFTGVQGTILETYQGLSRATDAKTENGSVNYYANVVNQNSKYVWFANDRSGAQSNTAEYIVSSTNYTPVTLDFVAGNDGADESNIDMGSLGTAWNMFASKEDVDIDLCVTGKSIGGTNGEQIGNYIYDNIISKRSDCVGFVSPDYDAVVNNNDPLTNVNAFFSNLEYNTYLVADSGYKYQYDKYNDVNRWIPLNGDMAGLVAAKDASGNVWDSPGNGAIKNCIKLAWNPDKTDRDSLYQNAINPVTTIPGQGTVLFGDKMHTTNATAFSRISIRRAFIYFEKTVAIPARAVLFKNNTPFTQNQFFNSIDPFFRQVKGLQGIEDYQIICDSRVNTPEVVSNFQFVGAIYIKPVYPINWVVLNFVAVRSGISFSEVVL